MKPYHIQQVQLPHVFDAGALTLAPGQNHYCIFWWQHLPLGELMLEAHEIPDAEDLRHKILEAIEPAVDHYIGRLPGVQGNYKDAFLKKDRNAFVQMLTSILNPFLVEPDGTALPPASVVICTRNRTADLQRCLESLYDGSVQPAEVIVVDNAPGSGNTQEIVNSFGARYVPEQRPGLSIARNKGLATATHDLLLFTDDDVVLHEHWYINTVKPFMENEVMGLTGLVLAAELETESQVVFEKFWRFNQGYVQKKFDRSFIDRNTWGGAPVWNIGAGANMAMRRSVFEQVGFFDEQLGAGAAGCSEDSELWFRMLLRNMPITYEPRSVARHYHRKTMPALRSQLFQYMQGAAVAGLRQQHQHADSNYRKYLLRFLPMHYLRLIKQGFPHYRLRYATLYPELTGLMAGILLHRRLSGKALKK